MSAIFHLRATEHDPEGYYFPRWDMATPVTVEAETQQDAIILAAKILGPTTRHRNWYWGFRLDRIEAKP